MTVIMRHNGTKNPDKAASLSGQFFKGLILIILFAICNGIHRLQIIKMISSAF